MTCDRGWYKTCDSFRSAYSGAYRHDKDPLRVRVKAQAREAHGGLLVGSYLEMGTQIIPIFSRKSPLENPHGNHQAHH